MAPLVTWLGRAVLVVGVAVGAAACTGSEPASTPTGAASTGPVASSGASGTTTKPSASAPARGSDTPDPSAVEFRSDQVSFDYPVGWHTRRGALNPGGNETIVFIGPSELPSECIEGAQGGACNTWPITTLGPNGALFAWRWWGRPGEVPPTGGDPMTVGGRAASVTKGPANDACQALGGDESIEVTVQPVDGSTGWFEAEACLAGPDRTAGETDFEAMLASATVR